jgi:hypothetical protein
MMDRSEFKSVSVLAHDYSAYDLADHIADVIETLPDGRSIWRNRVTARADVNQGIDN